jgi:dephospho-CoA kinase
LRVSPHFGSAYFNKEGELDRDAVAQKVFSDADARHQLERIVHPEIRMEMIRRIIQLALQGMAAQSFLDGLLLNLSIIPSQSD